MSKPDTPEIKGCTDGGCIFGHPGGMRTNGGCACLKTMATSSRLRVQRNIMLLRQEIQNLRNENEIKAHALQHISTCESTKLCQGCEKLATVCLVYPYNRDPPDPKVGS